MIKVNCNRSTWLEDRDPCRSCRSDCILRVPPLAPTAYPNKLSLWQIKVPYYHSILSVPWLLQLYLRI